MSHRYRAELISRSEQELRAGDAERVYPMKNKMFVLAVSVAIVTNLVLYVPNFTNSKYEYVRQLKFGTQKESVLAGFAKDRISCSMTSLNDSRQR